MKIKCQRSSTFTFLSISRSYWFDKPRFVIEGKLLLTTSTPSLGAPPNSSSVAITRPNRPTAGRTGFACYIESLSRQPTRRCCSLLPLLGLADRPTWLGAAWSAVARCPLFARAGRHGWPWPGHWPSALCDLASHHNRACPVWPALSFLAARKLSNGHIFSLTF